MMSEHVPDSPIPISSATSPGGRPTIALLAHPAAGSWRVFAKAASELGANPILFPTGYLDSPYGFEVQANVLFDLISPQRIDGLVICDHIANYVEATALAALCKRYSPLPIVLIGESEPMIEGPPYVLIDIIHGMRELMNHLVEYHGYRRIAFIGVEAQPAAVWLYQTYVEALAEHGIAPDPNLVAPSVFRAYAGAAAMRMLLDERRLRPQEDIEAVLAAHDNIALGVLEVLQERGIRVPEEVAVAGASQASESWCVAPSLTTIRYSNERQPRIAVEMLLAQLDSNTRPPDVTIPTEMVIRQSCGCLHPAIIEASAGRVEESRESLEVASGTQRHHVLSRLMAAVNASPFEFEPGGIAELLDAFIDELQGGEPGLFLSTLDHVLRWEMARDHRVSIWQIVISALRRELLSYLTRDPRLPKAEDLWQQARVMIGTVSRQVQGYKALLSRQRVQILDEISQEMITSLNVNELMDVLARQLPRLGIRSGFLSLYEDANAPECMARLHLAYDHQGRVELKEEGRRFPANLLVPDRLLDSSQPRSYVIEPLYFRERQLGFAVLEMGLDDEMVYRMLRGQISSALHGALLFSHNEDLYQQALEARAAAEKANQIKTRLLANVSHELRTPLNVILSYTRAARNTPDVYDIELPTDLLDDFQHIQANAEHLLRIINDLLDLSRAEIDELDLYPELIETRPFLEEIFNSIADQSDTGDQVTWHLQLPRRLPLIQADPVRLRQVLLNLLSNACKFTDRGRVVLGAEALATQLHIWVQDTGLGIPRDQQDKIFEPFATVGNTDRSREGIGLGLSISRRLALLHQGALTVESAPGQGSTFHLHLPLPSLVNRTPKYSLAKGSILITIASQGGPSPVITELCQRQGLELLVLATTADIDSLLADVQPAVLAWDLANADPNDWLLVRHIYNHPRLCEVPFLLFSQNHDDVEAAGAGPTSVVTKPVSDNVFLDALCTLYPPNDDGPVLIVDDDAEICEAYSDLVKKVLPGYSIRVAGGGEMALALMERETPSLVILDLMMPHVDGFEVLASMRSNRSTRQVPVLILSNRRLTNEDIRRLEQYAWVTFQSKGILTENEAAVSLQRLLSGDDTLPTPTSALVKSAVAFIHQNYQRDITRGKIAEAVGVSMSYLNQIFRQELGLSPIDYLNRFRVSQAKALLQSTDHTISTIAEQVGFQDPSYFGRVFGKQVGQSPSAYRKSTR